MKVSLKNNTRNGFYPSANRCWGLHTKNLYNHVLKNRNRLQLITSLDIYEEKDIIQQFCDSNGLKIKIRINNPLLPTNPELRRLTIYFNHNNDDDQSYLIVDMYTREAMS